MSDALETVVATVGDRKLTLGQVLRPARLSGQLDGMIRDAVSRIIVRTLAQAGGIEATVEELQTAADAMRVSARLHHAGDTNMYLKNAGLTIDDLEAEAEDCVLARKLCQAIPETEIDRYLEQSRAGLENGDESADPPSREEVRGRILAGMVRAEMDKTPVTREVW